MLMNERRTVSPWYYIVGGALIGVAAGIMLAPLVTAPEEAEGPGFGSRILKMIPAKVKVAGVVGGVKGAGKEAYREWRS